MTEPDPYAPPAAGAHPQEHATQPLPMTPLSSDTPFDVPRPSGSDLAPPTPSAPPYPPQGYLPPQAPAGVVVPATHQQPYAPYGQPVGVPYGQVATPYPPYGYPSVPRPTNGMAIAALVLGILWLYWIGSVLALIFGYIALAQIKRSPADAPQQGRGLAVAGVVLGWVGVAILVVPTVLFVLLTLPASGL